MTQPTRWEYKVVTVGGTVMGTKDEVIESKLNELGLDGWEAVNLYPAPGGGRISLALKRPLTDASRRRRARDQEA